MRKIIILGCFIYTLVNIEAQCVNNVSTDYSKPPNNNSLPDNFNILDADGNIIGNRCLNTFNWFPENIGVYGGYEPLDMVYAGISVGFLSNIMNEQSSPSYYNYIYDGPKPLGKNGWELLLLNLGRFPNGDPITVELGKEPGVPYIVLYNRYSGVIRVFVSFGVDGQGADAVEITLMFKNDKVSGLLRLSEGYDRALDQTTNVTISKTIAKDPNLSYKWMSADFQVAYDPCSCYHLSELEINVRKITTSTVRIRGGSTSLVDQPLVNNQNIVNPQDFLSNFNYNVEDDVASEGFVMYKSLQGMIDNYITEYDNYNKKLITENEHNKKVKQNLAMLKLAKTIIVFIATGVALDGSAITASTFNGELPIETIEQLTLLDEAGVGPAAYEELYKGLDGYQQGTFNLNSFKVALNKYKEIQTKVDKISFDMVFDIASRILGEKANLFINQNFKTRDLPTPPTMPTATFTEYNFSGTIITESTTWGPKFYTPGTFKNEAINAPTFVTSPYKYPIYNEILGTFALLESPKVKISKKITPLQNHVKQLVKSPINGPFYVLTMGRLQQWATEFQFQLDKDLKYKFNSALDIKKHEIKASFNIISNPKVISPPHPTVQQNSYTIPFINVNVSSNNKNINDDYTNLIAKDGFYSEQIFTNQQEFYYEPINFPPVKVNDGPLVQTTYVPINTFKPFVASFGIINNSFSYKTQLIPPYDVNDGNGSGGGSFDINENNEFDLTNPLIIKPIEVNPFTSGHDLTFDIELKLTVDIEFNTIDDQGKNNTLTMVLTYKVDPITGITIYDNAYFVQNLFDSNKNLDKYPYDLYFNEDYAFNGNGVINGCSLSGTNYTCQAINNVYINANLSTANGYTVEILAGNELIENPESVVSPEIILDVNPILDFSHPMPESTASYVSNFCKGLDLSSPAYQANTPTNRSLVVNEELESEEDLLVENDRISKLDFNLYPNPTRENVVVELNETINEDINLFITDYMGKEIQFNYTKLNSKKFNLHLTNVPSGIYFVTLKTNNKSIIKRLVKN
jgi:hypothetical protein